MLTQFQNSKQKKDYYSGAEADGLEAFLKESKPSTPADKAGSITVSSCHHKSPSNSLMENLAKLKKSMYSVRPSQKGDDLKKLINDASIADDYLSGKWLLEVSTNSVDEVWNKIALLTFNGQLGYESKVSKYIPNGKFNTQMICIYTSNFTDRDELMRVKDTLEKNNIYVTQYKPDAYTFLDIYKENAVLFEIEPTCNENTNTQGNQRWKSSCSIL